MFIIDDRLVSVNPDYYDIKVEFGNGIVIPDNIIRFEHIGLALKVTISYTGPFCEHVSCWTELIVIGEKKPKLVGNRARTVYCLDPILLIDPSSDEYPYKPSVETPCGGTADGPHFGGDWIEIRDCELGANDTAKVIYREWWAQSMDGSRVSVIDTINVLRLPPIDEMSLICPQADTVYCDSGK